MESPISQDELRALNARLSREGFSRATNWVESSVKAKSKLAVMLGMTGDWRARVSAQDPDGVAETRICIAVRGHLGTVLGGMANIKSLAVSACDGKIVNGKRAVRFGKAIIPRSNDTAWLAYRDSLGWSDLPAKWSDAIASLLETASSSARPVTLSLNPIDFLMASENCDYTSCLRWKGEYANGTLAYGLDGITAISFIESTTVAKRKLGRAWVYILPDTKQVIVGRAFGTYAKPAARAVSEHITSRLSSHLGISATWKARTDVSLPIENVKNARHSSTCKESAIYFDSCVSRIASHESIDGDTLPVLEFHSAVCLECGEPTDNSMGLTCEDCGGAATCDNCNSRIDEDSAFSENGSTYCESCYYEIFGTCYNCEETIANDDLMCGPDDNYYCEHCHSRKFIECEGRRCNTVMAKTDAYEGPDGNTYCESCIENFPVCQNCDERFEGTGDTCDDCTPEETKDEPTQASESTATPEASDATADARC